MTTFNTLNNTPPSSDQILSPIRGPSLTTPNTTTANLNKPPLTLSTPSQLDSNHPHTTTPGTTRPMSSALLRAQAILAQAASKSGANSGSNSPTPHNHPLSHSPYLKPSHPSVPDTHLDIPRNLLPPSSAVPSTKPPSGTSVLHHTTPIHSTPNIPQLPPNPPHTDINQQHPIMVPSGISAIPLPRASSYAAISINGSPITPSPIPSPVPPIGTGTIDGYGIGQSVGQTPAPSPVPAGVIEGSRLYNTMGHATLSLTQPLESPRSSKVLITANSIFDVPTPPNLSPADIPTPAPTVPNTSTHEVKSREYTNEQQRISSNSFIPPPPPTPSLATASTASTAFASSSSTVGESISVPTAPPLPVHSLPSVPVSNNSNHNYIPPPPPPHISAASVPPVAHVPVSRSSQHPYATAPVLSLTSVAAITSVPPPPPPPSLLHTNNTISSFNNALPIPTAAPTLIKQYEPPQSSTSSTLPVTIAPPSVNATPVSVIPPPPAQPHTMPQPYTQPHAHNTIPTFTAVSDASVVANKTGPSIPPPPPPHALTPHSQAPVLPSVTTETIGSGYHSGPTTIQFAPQSIPPPPLPPSSAAAPVLAHLAPSPAPSPAPSAKTSIRPPPVTGSVAFYSLPTPAGSSKVQAPTQSASPVSSNGGYNNYPATQQTQPQGYNMPPPPLSNTAGYQSGPPPPMSQYPSAGSSLQPPPMSQYPSAAPSLQPPPMPQYQTQSTPPPTSGFSSIPANRSSTNLNTVLSRQSSDDLGGVTPAGTRVRKPRIDPSQMPRPPNLDTDVIYYTLQPNTRKVPPLSNTGYKAIDTGNCNPRYIRATTAVPAVSASLQNTCGIPLGIIMTPFAAPENGEEPVPIVNYDGGFIRCIRCKGYLNPFVTWEKDGNIWVCNLCQTSNETPAW